MATFLKVELIIVEMLGHKKEKMLIVRGTVFIIVIFLNFANSKAQDALTEGSYVWSVGIDSDVKHFTFKDKQFSLRVENRHLGYIYYGIGYYFFKGDTLFLLHEKILSPKEFPLQITNKEVNDANQDLAVLKLNVVDTLGSPIQGAMVHLKFCEYTLNLLMTDESGKTQIYTDARIMDSILIRQYGYNERTISLDEFWGLSASITVPLQNFNPGLNQEEHVEKLVIIKEPNKTMLKDTKTGTLYHVK
ncbi:MAG: hypothetical protein ACJAVY_001763 [Marinoscillum sp.]|jgi:hypothetical protein